MASHAETVEAVARAIQTEYSYVEPQPDWDDLHEDSQAAWCHVARAAINAHNAARGT